MGPKAFEKEFKRRMGKRFNETKLFFFHDGSETKIAYIHGSKLRYVEMYRGDYWLDLWENHFKSYLQTGEFDTNAYWRVYTGMNPENSWLSATRAVPMKCVKQVWTVYSPEHNKHMSEVRSQEGMSGVGFKQQPKPLEIVT